MLLFMVNSSQAKEAIRQILPLGLKETISKVRSSVAYAVSAIAHWDWPEAWPGLFQILMEALTAGNSDAVHGAMRVLTGGCDGYLDVSRQMLNCSLDVNDHTEQVCNTPFL